MNEPRDEPEVRWAKARRYVALCNKAVQEAPWLQVGTNTADSILVVLELSRQAHQAHRLPHLDGLRNIQLYDPRRFNWLFDPKDEHVKVRDNKTGRIVIWSDMRTFKQFADRART